MKKAFAVLLAVAALSAAPARAQQPPRRPKIGVAFAGGGARGGAHVGVLKALEEARIPVDYVAGTSIGSIVAALYATGMSPAEMEEVLTKTDWDDALQDDEPRIDRPYRVKEDDSLYLVKAELGFQNMKLVLPGGLVAGQKLGYLLRRFTLPACEITDFDKLPIPFRAVGTDIVNGEKVVLSKGDVARAVRASMAIPGFFSPVELDGRLLVDGGSSDNLPIDVVRGMGADVIIAIDISTPLDPREKLNTFLAITSQTSGFLTRLNVLEQIATLTPKDLLITPDLEGISTLSFADFPKAVVRGEDVGKKMSAELRRFSVSEEEYAAFLKRQRVPRPVPKVDEVRTQSPPSVDRRLLVSRVRTTPGDVRWDVLEEDLASLYEIGDFETVDFRVVTEGDKHVLVYDARPRPPAPGRLRFGIKLDTDFGADSSFGLRVGMYKTRLNPLRGEFRAKLEAGRTSGLQLEFYQPADFRGRFFVSPSFGLSRGPEDVFQDDKHIARFLEGHLDGRVDIGYSFGSLGEVRAGILRERHDIKTETGIVQVDAIEDVAGAELRVVLDQVDSVTFPRKGWTARADALMAVKTAGGDYDYGRLKMRGVYALSFGETTLLPGLDIDAKLGGDDRPYFDQATYGGFFRISGLKPDQLRGQYGGVARIVAYQRLARFNSLVGTGVYAGGSIETGNTWNDAVTLDSLRFAGSLFLAADTFLGPLFVGYGLADGGRDTFYLSLGLPLN